MLVVGLTGGIATGKSTVSKLLKERSVPVIDADILARQVVEPGTSAYKQIVAYFGSDVLQPDGMLDRPKLGALIFNDETKRKKLNSIVHPAVRKAMFWEIVRLWIRGKKYCVLDIPLLIETGLYKWVGKVVVVYSPADIQLNRLMGRDNSEEDAAMARIRSQMPIAEKTKYADVVLDNSGELGELKDKISALVQTLEKDTRWTWMIEWLVPPVGLLMAALSVLRRRVA